MYFGKTVQNPEKYKGSGRHWKQHIKKHGVEHVVNLWYCLFYDKDDCVAFALNFSKQHNIVESEEWLNLKLKDGLGGVRTYDHIEKQRKSIKATYKRNGGSKLKGRNLSQDHTDKISKATSKENNPMWQKKHSEESLQKMRDKAIGRPSSKKGVVDHKKRNMKLRWYTNGSNVIYVTENTQPSGYRRGRK